MTTELEKKVHEDIVEMEGKVYGNPKYKFKKSIDDMNRALNVLRPENQTINELIKRVQKNSQELTEMVLDQQRNNKISPGSVP